MKIQSPKWYVSQYFLESHSVRMFQDCLHVRRLTFVYACHLVGPILSKNDTKLRPCIPIEVKFQSHWIYWLLLIFCTHLHIYMVYQGLLLLSLLEILMRGLKSCWGPWFFKYQHYEWWNDIIAKLKSLHELSYITWGY